VPKVLAVAALLGVLVPGAGGALGSPAAGPDDTRRYLAALDVGELERRGQELTSRRYSPTRLGKPLARIDHTYDYDFALLDRTRARLDGVDRRVALGEIFRRVTRGARTHTAKHLAVTRFLQGAAYHNFWIQPMERDRIAVFDPLVLLAVNEMRCGQVARIAVDLFDAAGYRARVVQAGAHVLAEIHYEGDWHFFEGDIFDGGTLVRDRDGSIPSVAELARLRAALDRPPHFIAFNAQVRAWAQVSGGARTGSSPYPSSYFFSRRAYGSGKPAYYVKTATRAQAQASRFYGWEHYETQPAPEIPLTDEPLRFQPGPPLWRSVEVVRAGGRATVRLRWHRARDRDRDVAGYRVAVSTRSRGWQYEERASDAAVARFLVPSGWTRASYGRLLRPLPADVALVRTTRTGASLSLPAGGRFYVSVSAFDRYGESIGKRVYFASEELRIRT
jgi:hypothetical protein